MFIFNWIINPWYRHISQIVRFSKLAYVINCYPVSEKRTNKCYQDDKKKSIMAKILKRMTSTLKKLKGKNFRWNRLIIIFYCKFLDVLCSRFY